MTRKRSKRDDLPSRRQLEKRARAKRAAKLRDDILVGLLVFVALVCVVLFLAGCDYVPADPAAMEGTAQALNNAAAVARVQTANARNVATEQAAWNIWGATQTANVPFMTATAQAVEQQVTQTSQSYDATKLALDIQMEQERDRATQIVIETDQYLFDEAIRKQKQAEEDAARKDQAALWTDVWNLAGMACIGSTALLSVVLMIAASVNIWIYAPRILEALELRLRTFWRRGDPIFTVKNKDRTTAVDISRVPGAAIEIDSRGILPAAIGDDPGFAERVIERAQAVDLARAMPPGRDLPMMPASPGNRPRIEIIEPDRLPIADWVDEVEGKLLESGE